MDRCPDIITYNEGSAPFFDRVLLRDDQTVTRRLRRLPFPVVVLKPICESHRAVEFLSEFPGARIIWIYRGYRDTVNSAVAKWKTSRKHLKELATGDAGAGWRFGGLNAAKLELVREVYDDGMSLHAADAMFWYLRTSLYFDLGLNSRDDVLLVKYEDLVTGPATQFPRIFSFLGCDFSLRYLEGVYSSSVASTSFPSIPERITRLCTELEVRLDAHYHEITALDPVAALPPGAS